jgi:hypothetical protein
VQKHGGRSQFLRKEQGMGERKGRWVAEEFFLRSGVTIARKIIIQTDALKCFWNPGVLQK